MRPGCIRRHNRPEQALEGITLAVAGKWLGREESHIAQVTAGQTCRRPLPIRPELAGEHVVEITLKYRQGGYLRTWTAHTLFKVLRQNESLANLTLNIDPSTNLSGDKIGFGQSIRKPVHEGQISGLIHDSHDLRQRKSTPARQERAPASGHATRPACAVPGRLSGGGSVRGRGREGGGGRGRARGGGGHRPSTTTAPSWKSPSEVTTAVSQPAT